MGVEHKTDFWHPPLWKWCAFLLLGAGSVLLFRFHPAPKPVKVEQLNLNYPTPTWDGSYPSVVIPLAHSGEVNSKGSVSLIKPTVNHDSPVNQAEVALDSGMFKLRQTDLFVSDVIPLALTRTYLTGDYFSRGFGIGAGQPYDICQTGTNHPYTYMDLTLEDGRRFHFPRISKGTGYADAVYGHYATASEFYGAQWAWTGTGWKLDLRDGREFQFPDSYHAQNCAQAAPVEIRDANGNRLQLKRSKVRRLEGLVSPSGHTITLKYDGSDRIIEAEDANSLIKYSYNSSGRLEAVADASRVLYRFEYDSHGMTTIKDGNEKFLLRNVFDPGSRVSEQHLADGEIYRYDYLLDKKHKIVETTIALPSGEVKRFFFHDGIVSGEK